MAVLLYSSTAEGQIDIPALKVEETSRGILVLWLKVKKVPFQLCLLHIDWKHSTSLLPDKQEAGRKETERCTLRLAAFTSSRVLWGNGRKENISGLLTKTFSGIKFHRKFLSFFYLFSFCLLYLLCTQNSFISLLSSCFVIFQFKKCKK